MSQTLLKNAYIITMNKQSEAYRSSHILIENDRIKSIGDFDDKLRQSDVAIIDCDGKIVMPGLINTHVHATQQLGRGLAEDVAVLTWLRKTTWPYVSSQGDEEQ